MTRIWILGPLTAACLFVPSISSAQSTFHGNPARTGVFTSAGPRTTPRTKWTFKAGGPIVTSPIVARGVVYISSLDGHLYAVDQATGAERWNFKSRMPIASSPAIGDSTLYFVSSAGSLAALNLADGQPRWVLPTEYERKFEAKNLHGYPSPAQTIPDAWDLFTSSPALVDGIVYFGCGDGGIYAVDATSGLLRWKVTTGDVVHASPAVVDGTVYIGSWDSNLYAIDARTGQTRWTFKSGEDPAIHNQVGFQSSPAVVEGTVYVGCRDAHVYAIDAKTGKRRWDYPTAKSWVIGTPAVEGGVVYVGTSDSARFMALDATTGRLLWNFDSKAYLFSSPAIAGDHVYVGCHNGKLYALDRKSGTLAWEFQTEASRLDRLNVLEDDGSFRAEAFAPTFGDFQDMYLDFARYLSIGGIFGSPAVDGGTLFIGSTDGNLYALE